MVDWLVSLWSYLVSRDVYRVTQVCMYMCVCVTGFIEVRDLYTVKTGGMEKH